MSTLILVILAAVTLVTIITYVVVGIAARRPAPSGQSDSAAGRSAVTRTRRFFAGSVGGAGLLAAFAILVRGDMRDRVAGAFASSPETEMPTAASTAEVLSDQPTPAPIATATALPVPTGTAGATSTVAPEATRAPVSTSTPAPQAPTAVAQRSVPRQPNVLVITVDTTRADHVGAYGFAQAHTPNIDRIAAEGARFARAYCQLPQTNASHASLFTGLYPSTSGLRVHMVDKLRPNTQTLSRIFGSSGYKTAGIYSWVSMDAQFSALDQGFQTYKGFVVNRNGLFANSRLEDLAALYRQVKDKVAIVRTVDVVLGSSTQVEESMDGRADVTAAAALDWLDTYSGPDPFLLWVHFFDPHYSYSPPAGFDHVLGLDYKGNVDGSLQTMRSIMDGKRAVSDADRARILELYQGEISFADSQIGRILDALRRRGLEDDTVIVVAADHGEGFGEHGKWIHGLGINENDIHVPLVMRYPARIPAGKVVGAPVQIIDVLPTLADIAGLKVTSPVQGSSLLSLVNGKPALPGQGQAFTELADLSQVSLVSTLGNTTWHIIRNNANGQIELYNLDSDVAEKRNLASSEAKAAAQLNAQLAVLMKTSGVTK